MRTLVVEDEVRLARHVSRALTNAGHETAVVHDGEAAARYRWIRGVAPLA